MGLAGEWDKEGEGYEERIGPGEEDWLHYDCKANVIKKLCCITNLIDHTLQSLEAAYAGTVYEKLWMLYHDGLTAWWTPAAQRHIVAKGLGNRQVCSRYPTNSTYPVNPLVASRYAIKVTGDSPEMAVSTDNQGNSYEIVLIKNVLFINE